jgi:nucleotide-binding universal stress UspA family protein
MISRILVPTDGSGTARKAAEYAFGLASMCRATVTLLTVVDKSAFVGRPSVPASDDDKHIAEPLEDYLREAAEVDMGRLEDLGKARGVATKKVIRYGQASEEIIREAETSNTDLIVMGSHGRSGLRAVLLGSVTNAVIQHDTKVPVLLVRR